MLRALASNAIELADGHGELAIYRPLRPAIEWHEILHRALAERALTEHDAAFVVLNRAGEDLRCRRAEAIHQHRERTIVLSARLWILEHFEPARRVLQLHDRSLVDEETRERGRFRQITAAVVAQIEHESVDLLRLQLREELAYIACGAAIVLIASTLR